MKYTQQDIIDSIENYKKIKKPNIRFIPKRKKSEKIISYWLKNENVMLVSKKFKISTTKLISILKYHGIEI